MADPVTIEAADLIEEIGILSKQNSMIRLEVKARAKNEDKLRARIAQLEAAAAPKSNRAERRRKAKGS